MSGSLSNRHRTACCVYLYRQHRSFRFAWGRDPFYAASGLAKNHQTTFGLITCFFFTFFLFRRPRKAFVYGAFQTSLWTTAGMAVDNGGNGCGQRRDWLWTTTGLAVDNDGIGCGQRRDWLWTTAGLAVDNDGIIKAARGYRRRTGNAIGKKTLCRQRELRRYRNTKQA